MYREQRPPDAFARWIECAWSSETTEEGDAYSVRPDGCIDIVYSPAHGLRIVGTMTAEQRFHFPAGMQVVGVRFSPGKAGTCLGVAPPELTDESIALEDAWGARARTLEQRLREAKSPGETVALLLNGIPRPQAQPNSVQRAIEAISAHRGACDLDEVASQAK